MFTASTKSYADPIIDHIDPHGYITGRYYREHCKTDNKGNLIKPMDVITQNLKKLIIIDDSELVHGMYKENTILIDPWTPFSTGRKNDKGLLMCLNIFEQLRYSNP